MTSFESEPGSNWPEIVTQEQQRLGLGDLSAKQLSDRLAEHALGQTAAANRMLMDSAYKAEAAERLARLDNLENLLGLVAPSGTAPRTAIEQIFIQSKTSDELSEIGLDFRRMLEPHYGEWTPALREAEGIPPADDTQA